MKVIINEFGEHNGEKIYRYDIANDHGVSVALMNYGATIIAVNTPDRNQSVQNIVVGYDTFSAYLDATMYAGAATGRVAGRISNAEFEIDQVKYVLPANNNGNCLHGGLEGFDKKIFDVKIHEDTAQVALDFHYLSKDMEEGFPGNLDLVITYTLNNQNQFIIDYNAKTDRTTPVTITNHTYWNLSGDLQRPILEQKLMIDAKEYIKIHKNVLPDQIASVENTPFDLRNEKILSSVLLAEDEQIQYANGYDHPFVFREEGKGKIKFWDEISGRVLRVETTEPCVVVYSSSRIDSQQIFAKNVQAYNYVGLALETQGYPDAVNKGFKGGTLSPLEKYQSRTLYHFEIE